MPEKPEKKAAIEEALRGFKFRNPIRDKVGKGKKKKTKGLKGGKGKSARTEKPGVPHGVDKKTQKGEQILEVAKGGSVTGRGIGPAGASIVSDDGKRIKQLKTIAKSLASPTTAGLIGGFKKAAGQLAGRLAKRGYGKARK
jgi:hypothetical protein